jgi:hypothetical protein
LLKPDAVIHRRYVNNIGQEAYIWVMFWRSGGTILGYHHPDVCWGNRGLVATDQWFEPVSCRNGAIVPVTAREFKFAKPQQLVYYWTQEGARIWSDLDEQAAKTEMMTSSWQGHRWVGDLIGARSVEQGARLQVMVIVPDAGTIPRKNASQLAGFLSDSLYQLCPWALPQPNANSE